MKILLYSFKSSYSGKPYGGAEKSMALLAESLSKIGHDVHYLSGVDGVRFARSKQELINGVLVHFLPIFNLPLKRFKPIMKLNNFIRNKIFYSYMTENFMDFEIVSTCNEYPALYQIVKWQNSNKPKCKCVYRTAGLYWHYSILNSYPFLRDKVEFTFRNLDSFNFISQEIKGSFLKIRNEFDYQFDVKDSFILDVGVETEFTRTWKPRCKGPFTIVMVARFSDHAKRQDILIEAFKNWANPNAQLVFLGDGPKLKEYKNLIESDYFLKQHTKVIGFVNPSEVKEYLLNSDLFCLCTDYEGVPQSVLEAMAIGIPVMISNIDAHQAIVQHGENGYLVNNDFLSWEEALRMVHDVKPDHLSSLSENARKFIQLNHSLEKSARMYETEFTRIIKL